MSFVNQRKVNPEPRLQLENNPVNPAKPVEGFGSGNPRTFRIRGHGRGGGTKTYFIE